MACGGGGYPYPSSITDYFGESTLVRASNWVRDGTSAAVYVREGEMLPTAGLQVGVIVSYDKPEAAQLSSWLLYEAAGAAGASRAMDRASDDDARARAVPFREDESDESPAAKLPHGTCTRAGLLA